MSKKAPRDLNSWSFFLGFAELVLAYATNRAYPIFGEIFKSCAGSNAAIGVAHCRIVFVSANVANVLFHKASFFEG